MRLGIITKQPADVTDVDVDFSEWLPEGDTITTATAVTDASGDGVLTVDSVQFTTQVIKVWLSAGVSGETSKVTVTAATAGGRVKEAEFRVRVRDY